MGRVRWAGDYCLSSSIDQSYGSVCAPRARVCEMYMLTSVIKKIKGNKMYRRFPIILLIKIVFSDLNKVVLLTTRAFSDSTMFHSRFRWLM